MVFAPFSRWLPRVSGSLKTTDGVIRERVTRHYSNDGLLIFVSRPFRAKHKYGDQDIRRNLIYEINLLQMPLAGDHWESSLRNGCDDHNGSLHERNSGQVP